jgi:hypothetical protein
VETEEAAISSDTAVQPSELSGVERRECRMDFSGFCRCRLTRSMTLLVTPQRVIANVIGLHQKRAAPSK